MADLDGIAAARSSAQAVESDARDLGNRLAAAKLDRRLLRRELKVLPPRLEAATRALADARGRLEAATAARDALVPRVEAAQANAAAADQSVEDLEAQIAAAQQELENALSEDPRPPIAVIQALQQEIQRLGDSAATAGRAAATAHAGADRLAGELADAETAVRTAQADVAARSTERVDLEAALATARGRQEAVEAQPAELAAQMVSARERVRAAWEPWTRLLQAVHADLDAAVRAQAAADEQVASARLLAAQARHGVEAAERAGDEAAVETARVEVEQRDAAVAAADAALALSVTTLDRRRRELVGELGPEDIVSLVAADVPLVLLPVRLETRLERHGDGATLLVRIYPDTIHASSHEPELTADEFQWGTRFLAAEAAGEDEAAWRQLADRFGAPRASWIARAARAGERPARAAAWTRAPTAAVLPDRWIALGHRDGQRRFAALGAPITDRLAVGPGPYEAPSAAPLGESARWMIDFDRAVEAGMALRIELGPEDAAGLDRLVVVGVRATGDDEDGARRLAAVLDGHRYTDSLGLVPPGTPTNNTPAARSGWTATGAGAGAPHAGAGEGTDAARLARALGVDPGLLADLPDAGATHLADERAMATALWPVTWGYMLEQLAGGIADGALAETRSHVLDHVRSHGALPVVRAGNQPYGVLPSTSLERWNLLDPADVDAVAPPLLRALVPAWHAAAASVARVTADTAIEDVLVEALAMSPVSVAFAARGLELQPPSGLATFTTRQSALEAVRALGLDLDPLLSRAGFEVTAEPLTGPLVAPAPSETEPLPPEADYIAWLARADLDTLRTGSPPSGANTLLFALLRHALLREYAATTVRILRARGLAQPGEGAEPGAGAPAPSPWARLAAPLEGVTGGTTLAVHLDAVRAAGDAGASPAAPQLTELLDLQASLLRLSGVPTARLARLLAGTLDLTSHRLDAWIGAHAGRRLEALREQRPRGARIGGYGVVEDVRPAAQAAHPEPVELAHNQGHVHAPSLGQAATAAVLRSGHLAHRNEADSPFAVDLSSRRVRLALRLLEGVRAGQSLGALLGYRFERGLHEGHPGLALDRHIATLRGLAPLDDLTRAEHDLGEAMRREAGLADRMGRLEAQLTAARDADEQAKDALRAQLELAESERDAALADAEQHAATLQQAQAALQALLDAAAGGEPSPVPAWKFGEDDAGLTWIPSTQRTQIRAHARAAALALAAFDRANALAGDAARRVDELTAALGVANPVIASLVQAITELQPELEAARAAVVAVRERVDALGGTEAQPSEALRARNVADGLALRERWRTGQGEGRWDAMTIPFGDPELGLPALGTPEHHALDAELRAIDDAVDALSDLLLAESVHQLVQGNPLRAGATVDALSRGDAVPVDVEVVRTPRGGTAVTHRLVVLVDPDGRATGWPTDDTQIRAAVEPALEAWAAGVLGPASRVRVRARYVWAEGATPADADLSVLRLSALDVVAMAGARAAELEARLLDHFAHARPPVVPEDAAVELELGRDPSWTGDLLSLPELLEVARELRDLLAGARALDGRDLALPGDRADPGLDTGDLATRAADAVSALEAARAALAEAAAGGAGAARRGALLRSWMLGIPGSVPGEDDDARCGAVLRELDRRVEAAAAAAGERERIAAVLGEDFSVLPRLRAPNPEVAVSLASSDALQGGDPLAAVTWLQRAAHVREGSARLEGVLLYAEAVGSPERLGLRVAQLPHRAGDRWVALPLAGGRIEGGRLSLVAQTRAPVEPSRPLAGLLVDEWTETVPDATQMTGLSFHFDQPSSRAPQAILLAVPPTEERLWSLAALEAVVLETLDLARLRLVDPDALARPALAAAVPRLGHYLPAAYVARAPAAETVTSDLGRVVAAPVPG